MDFWISLFEFLKAVILGVIQGITEWLPVSSTGHMILFDSFWPMDQSKFTGGRAFVDLFLVVIQFGSILAVLVLYFHKLNPFSTPETQVEKRQTFSLWLKVIFATIPAMVLGLLFDDMIEERFYNAVTVSVMLIAYGIFFLLAENRHPPPENSELQPAARPDPAAHRSVPGTGHDSRNLPFRCNHSGCRPVGMFPQCCG